jgi:alpha-tubulin suppressor-like RCC1 family protein
MKLKHLLTILLMALFAQWVLPVQAAGTWTPVTAPPTTFSLMLLLTDGTVMALDDSGGTGNQWYRLAPDASGGYVNGTWTQLASMHDSRLYFSSQVLTNGKVLVAGGEYGTGTSSAEIYDPLLNTWTYTPAAGVAFSDSISKLLPSGDVIVGPAGGGTMIYSVSGNSWHAGTTPLGNQNEADWVKLPDDTLLTVDCATQNSERHYPSLPGWLADATVPVKLYSNPFSEEGAGHLLPNGKAFFIGGRPVTAIYTPSGQVGSWEPGPKIPNNLGALDAPSAMMVNGKILCVVGPTNDFVGPSTFFEYNYGANSFTQVNGPTGTTDNVPPYTTVMLDLPNGQVLYQGAGLYVYTPDGSPLAAGKPVISSFSTNVDGSFHLTGTGFNGLDTGAKYGDDKQMDSNYPIVRMTNLTSGVVYFGRTYAWNSTSVQTGSRVIATEFNVQLGLPAGSYSLVVTANGIASAPITATLAPPSRPTGLIARPGNEEVIVQWNAVPGATNYNVKWSTTPGGPYDLLASTTSTNFTHVVGVNGQTFYYVVSAVDSTAETANSSEASATPNAISPGQFAAGYNHSLAVKLDGTVWAWGDNSVGELGDGTTTDRHTPVRVLNLSNIVSVAAGNGFSIALKSDNTVWTWGRNGNGQLGDGTTNTRHTPAMVPGLSNVLVIAAGLVSSYALRVGPGGGEVWVWGDNSHGELGDGTTTDRHSPVQANIQYVLNIAPGNYHVLALHFDGTLWAWGNNGSGQIGIGTAGGNVLSPVQVNLPGVTAISAGGMHSVAVDENNNIWTWGDNSTGQLGDGTTTDKHSPQMLDPQLFNSIGIIGDGVVGIAAGYNHTLATTTDGAIWSWGANGQGQLGDGTKTDRHSPVSINGPTQGSFLTAGTKYSLISLNLDNTLDSWGNNGSGQVGDGSTTDRTVPVGVVGFWF